MSDDIKTESDKKNKKIYRRVGLAIGIIIIFICIALNYFTKNSLYNGKIADNIL